MILSVDITERKSTEAALRRSNRALAVLSRCSQTLVRAKDERRFMEDVCLVVVETGGYRLAWIGMKDEDGSRSVRPVARAGVDDGYVDRARATWDESARGAGPMGRAIRSGQPVAARFIATDPELEPWREDALARGFASCIALPIRDGGEVLGAMAIYAAEPDAFDEAECALLSEMALDLGYGIATLRSRAASREIEARVVHLNAVLRGIRDVNQLITRERDPQALIQEACRLLVDSRGFGTSCIVLCDRERIVASAGAGAEPMLSAMRKMFADNELPDFIKDTLGQTDVLVRHVPTISFECCPVNKDYSEQRDVAAVRLEAEGRACGALLVSLARGMATDQQELDLLKEIAGDVAFALRSIDLEAERHAAEQALMREQERYRDLVANLEDIVFTLDAEGRVEFMSPAAERIYGTKPNEVLGRNFAEFIHPEDLPSLAASFERTLAGAVEPHQFRAFDTQGRLRHMRSKSRIRMDGGRVVGMDGVMIDITDLWQAQDSLRESERRFRGLFENISSGVAVYEAVDEGRDFVFKDFNASGERIDRITRERVIGRRATEVFPGVESFGLLDVLRRVWKTGTAEMHPVSQYQDGRIAGWRENRVFKLPSGEIVSVYDDMTEHKQAAEDLRQTVEQRRELEFIINRSPGVAFLWRAAEGWPVEYVSDNVRQFGYTPEDFYSGRVPYASIVHPDDVQRVAAEVVEHSAEKGSTEFVQEYRIRSSSGRVLWIDDRTWIRRNDRGEITHYQGIVLDITKRKQAEEALRASEAQLSNALKIAHAGHWEYDVASDTFTFNDNFYRIFRTTAAEVGSCTMRSAEYAHRFCHPDDMAYVGKEIQAALETADPNYERQLEHRILYANGEVGYIAVRFFIVKDEQGRTVRTYGVNQDITEIKRMQDQVLLSQKMESIGRLAGGVAHDFNNLLSVIIGYAGAAAEALRESDPVHADVVEIRNAGQRAAVLTRQLLAFSRKQLLEPEVLDLNKVISGIESMLRRLLGEDIDIEVHLAEGLGSVMADFGQIEQVIMNLAVNARDAMPRGGKLTIETANAELDEGYAEQHVAVEPGRFVMLSVTDTGTGMNAETKAHVFDPFFTTKEKGKGTGLGLSTVYGIVKQSGGNIWVYSEPGHGTTFKVYLPSVDAPAVDVRRRPSIAPATGKETVLIVEDEDAVRRLAERILRGAGFRVHTAASGGDALVLYEKLDEAIDLLLTDVVMPQMSGRELAERLAGSSPGLKVLFMSGYTDNAIAHHGVLDPGTHFIGKPFAAVELARKVRELLDEGKTAGG